MTTPTTPTEVGGLTEAVIYFRDRAGLTRADRDMLADVCNALSAYRACLETNERRRLNDEMCQGA